MTLQPAFQQLTDIEDLFDIFLVDMVGVIYDGKEMLPGALDALLRLRGKGKNIILMTNNPRPRAVIRSKLNHFGVPEDIHIFSSGDATRAYITEHYPSSGVYHLGAATNKDILAGLSVPLVDLAEADYVLVTLYCDAAHVPEKIDKQLREVAQSGKEILCANPDTTASHGAIMRKTAGFFCHQIEAHGAPVTYIGKPNPFGYELLWQEYGFREADKKRTLMIGDTLETDVAGADTFGLPSLLVMSGNTGAQVKGCLQRLTGHLRNHPSLPRPTYCTPSFL